MANLRANSIVGVGSTNAGIVFDGATKIKTQNYFYLQTGNTENRFPNFAGVDASSARGVFAGGYAATNIIDYITISSTGNASDFGDLIGASANAGAVASPVRGVFAGGYLAPAVTNAIQYITISSTGNTLDFGDLTSTRNNTAGCSSSTRGIFAGGAPNINTIEYITIFSSGNSIDFGDLVVVRSNAGGCSSPTRGIFGGGDTSPPANSFTNSIDYVTIATTANALDFGDLSAPKDPAACSNSIRGLFAGGRAPTAINVIEYITIASTGNVTDFGDLSGIRRFLEGTSSSIRGVFGGGYTTSPVSTAVNIIEYVTILTTGNAVDFGDLTLARFSLSACSNGHGGLG